MIYNMVKYKAQLCCENANKGGCTVEESGKMQLNMCCEMDIVFSVYGLSY